MLTFVDNLSAKHRTLLLGAALLLGLSTLGYSAIRIYRGGVPVVLETAPVDPQSLFQGEYVRLSYAISGVNVRLFDDAEWSREVEQGQAAYVELAPGQPVWTPVHASLDPIVPKPGNVVIRGEATYAHKVLSDTTDLRLNYGIETFMAPPGEALPVEQAGRADRQRVTVLVLVAPDGAALPKNILIGGKPVFTDGGL